MLFDHLALLVVSFLCLLLLLFLFLILIHFISLVFLKKKKHTIGNRTKECRAVLHGIVGTDPPLGEAAAHPAADSRAVGTGDGFAAGQPNILE